MKLLKCYLTNSPWFKGAVKNGTPVGILWHDTGAGNTTLKRYVQPMPSDANYNSLMAQLGKNTYNNDWNHTSREVGVNAFIGKLADGSVATVQCSDWTLHPWGCGGGSKGSCNGYIKANGKTSYVNPMWIQFEICDDGYKDKAYFEAVYKEACELTAYLCKLYNIDPKGTVTFNGISVPTILCHQDSYQLGLGGNHGDVLRWFNTFGKTMADVRKDVSDMITPSKDQEATPTPTPVVDDSSFSLLEAVKIKSGVTKFANGANMASFVKTATLYVRKINGNLITVSTQKTGAVTGTVYASNLEAISNNTPTPEPTPAPTPVTPTEVSFKVLDIVKVKSGVTKFANGANMASFVRTSNLYVRAINGNIITVSTQKTGAITGNIKAEDLILVSTVTPTPTPTPTPVSNNSFKILDIVKVKSGVTKFANGVGMASFVRASSLYVRGINGNLITISTQKTGAITGVVKASDLTLVKKAAKVARKTAKTSIADNLMAQIEEETSTRLFIESMEAEFEVDSSAVEILEDTSNEEPINLILEDELCEGTASISKASFITKIFKFICSLFAKK